VVRNGPPSGFGSAGVIAERRTPVTSEITIQISVPLNGAAVAKAVSAGTTGEGPAPLPIEELSLAGTAMAPRPLAPEALDAAVSAADTPPAPPMDIAALFATALESAPVPMDIGALEVFAATPEPALLPEGGVGAEEAPAPMSPEQLAQAAEEGGDSKERKR
jgi:hypothetical protein